MKQWKIVLESYIMEAGPLAQLPHTDQDAPSTLTSPTCLHLAHVPVQMSL